MKTFCLTIVLIVLLSSAYAQPQDAPSPRAAERGDDRDMAELIESVMAARLAKELELNEEQTVIMVRGFSEFRERLNEMQRQRNEKLRALRVILRDNKPDEEVEAALDDLIRHDAKTLEFRHHAYQKAAGHLSTSQRAKLYVFISDFEGDMRRLIQRARERRPDGNRPHVRPGPSPFQQRPTPQNRPDADTD